MQVYHIETTPYPKATIKKKLLMYIDLINSALQEYGTNELLNGRTNPRILEYRSTIGLSSTTDNFPWCAAFTNFILKKEGYKYLKSLLAKDFLKYGTKTDKPTLGCIVVFWREDINSNHGHVGFFISEFNGYIYVLSGNQSNEVRIQPHPKARLLQYVVPTKII